MSDIPPFLRPKKFWDVSVGLSNKKLASFMRAVFFLYGRVTDHLMIGHKTLYDLWKSNGRIGTCYVYIRLELPEGMEEEFQEMTGLKLEIPPKVHAN